MSRSGYDDDYGSEDPLALGRYRQAVKRALTGKRGQAFLRETLAALDAMPVKELAPDSLATATGGYCTLGVVGAARGIDLTKLDPDDPESVAAVFGIAESMAREIVYENDEVQRQRWVEIDGPPIKYGWNLYQPDIRVEETPAQRWQRMRAWVAENITPPQQESKT